MTHRTWNLALDGIQHTVELEHGYFSGKRSIKIDGRELALPPSESRQSVDFGSRHAFSLAGHACEVVIGTNGVTFSYDLVVDGRSLATGAQDDGSSKGAFNESDFNRIRRYGNGAVLVIGGILGL